jgi:hypothetical protein
MIFRDFFTKKSFFSCGLSAMQTKDESFWLTTRLAFILICRARREKILTQSVTHFGQIIEVVENRARSCSIQIDTDVQRMCHWFFSEEQKQGGRFG